MDYNTTLKKDLIKMLKAAQKNETKLAAELAKSRKIAEQTMANNARLRGQLGDECEPEPFKVGDLVKIVGGNGPSHWATREIGNTARVDTIIRHKEEGYPIYVAFSNLNGRCDDNAGWLRDCDITHAPTCPECEAKQKRVEKLEKKVEQARAECEQQVSIANRIEEEYSEHKRCADEFSTTVQLSREALQAEYTEYKRGVQAELATKQQEIDTQAATIDELADECETLQMREIGYKGVIVKQAAQLNGEIV
jgi:predicted RNase H-like nuclease (RuvC/YqgF family)